MQKLIVERGADCRVQNMHPLRCSSCQGFHTDFRVTTPREPWRQALGFDPPCAQLLAFLGKLQPCEELVMRMALRGISAHCRTDREWQRRVDELMAQLKPDAAQFARLVRRAAKTVAAIEAMMASAAAVEPATRHLARG